MLAVRCHCEAVGLSAGEAREVGCGEISGESRYLVSSLGRYVVVLCAVTGIPAQRNDFHTAIHSGRQILGHTGI